MNRRSAIALLGAGSFASLSRATSPKRILIPEPTPLERGIRFLESSQSEDGAWRSRVYGGFRDGQALTGPVAAALRAAGRGESVEKATRWLSNDWTERSFPVHTASAITSISEGDLCTRAMERLQGLQVGSHGSGWRAIDPAFGGWSYSSAPPQRRNPLPAMHMPNVAATATAIEGLERSKSNYRTQLERARRFLLQHQNQDGGFFEILDDPTRNKAGADGDGYRSYTAATLDALRGLLGTGLPWDAPEISRALRWLSKKGNPLDVPDLRFYGVRQAAVIAARPGCPSSFSDLANRWRTACLADISEAGSWSNSMGEMRENDPLVATSLVVEALAVSIAS